MKWCAVRSLAQDRKFEFDLERATFAMALQRLCAPGSDLGGSEWVKTVAAPGFQGLALQHFYRTVDFLAGVRQDLESRLFHRDLNLFNQTLVVVFLDTTSLYGYRDTETEWRQRGYVVCRNPQAAARDGATREAILAKLREKLAQPGAKAMVGHKGYARFLKVAQGAVAIDEDAVQRDARLDVKFVLTTNTALPTAAVAQTYQSRWRVARTFREQKSTLEVRPIYHHRDDTSIGHIVAAFLALRLEVDLQQRLDDREAKVSWPDLRRDLGQVQSVAVDLDGQRDQLRTDLVGAAHHACAAAGVRPPSAVTPLGPVS